MTFQLRLILCCIALLCLVGCITIATPFGVIELDYDPDWVVPTLDPTPTIEVFPTAQPMETGRVTTLKLNVRTSAGTQYPLSSVQPFVTQGQVVEILQRALVGKTVWYQIAIPPSEEPIGWASGDFIEPDRG